METEKIGGDDETVECTRGAGGNEKEGVVGAVADETLQDRVSGATSKDSATVARIEAEGTGTTSQGAETGIVRPVD